ncbi:MAG: hypothetical protein MJZ34_07190 [Paludibacteraceae bacterium]|nr:hypothetical protein [Paludibacteraceae bacterium]
MTNEMLLKNIDTFKGVLKDKLVFVVSTTKNIKFLKTQMDNDFVFCTKNQYNNNDFVVKMFNKKFNLGIKDYDWIRLNSALLKVEV